MSAHIPAQNLIEGDPASSVRLLIYEDLQCPDSANFREMMDSELLPRFQDRVAFEHRDFPLAKHSWALAAAVAARYFEKNLPQLALEFRIATMAAQSNITQEAFGEHVAAFARANGADPAKAMDAIADPALNALVESSCREGIARGVARTPTVLVNGDPFVERFPAAEIIRSIERELAATNPRPSAVYPHS